MSLKTDARAILLAGIDAVRPRNLLPQAVSLSDGQLRVADYAVDLTRHRKVHLFGCGKAAEAMAECIEALLGEHLAEGLIVGLPGEHRPLKSRVVEASHPVPSQRSIDAALRIKQAMSALTEDDFFIFLLSGGASAMLEIPLPPITLDELTQTGKLLLASGLDITRINAVRKHLSQIKGGRLAEALRAPGLILVISDVIGDRLDTIGSGPLYCDDTSYREAIDWLREARVFDRLPASVRDVLEQGARGEIAETPKTLNPGITHVIIGTNRIALDAARQRAEDLGYRTEIRDTAQTGEASEVARRRARDFLQATAAQHRVCQLFGGETTVTFDRSGQGGRNQEFVLAALAELHGEDNVCVAAAGSDGIDGNSPAAGAVADAATFAMAQAQGLALDDHLARHDSYNYFKATDDLIISGPTGTNVMDISLFLKG